MTVELDKVQAEEPVGESRVMPNRGVAEAEEAEALTEVEAEEERAEVAQAEATTEGMKTARTNTMGPGGAAVLETSSASRVAEMSRTI